MIKYVILWHQASSIRRNRLTLLRSPRPQTPGFEVERDKKRGRKRERETANFIFITFRAQEKINKRSIKLRRCSPRVRRTSVAAAMAFLHQFSTFECALHIFVCRYFAYIRFDHIYFIFMYFMQIHDTKMNTACGPRIGAHQRVPSVWQEKQTYAPIHLQCNPVAHRKIKHVKSMKQISQITGLLVLQEPLD